MTQDEINEIKCVAGTCLTPSAPCRGKCIEAIQPRGASFTQWGEDVKRWYTKMVEAFEQSRKNGNKYSLNSFDAGYTAGISDAFSEARDQLKPWGGAIGVPAETVPVAWRDVLIERQRQVVIEGWDDAHDNEHNGGQLSAAAAAYALNAADQLNPYSEGDGKNSQPPMWPWNHKWWNPKTPRRDLVRAGALIIAEIERLDRAEKGEVEP